MRTKDVLTVNKNKRDYLATNERPTLDVVVFNTHNSPDHEITKAVVALKLQQLGRTFVCEALLKSGGRPDILVLDCTPPIAYEILNSEKVTNVPNKQKSYGDIKVIPIVVNETIRGHIQCLMK